MHNLFAIFSIIFPIFCCIARQCLLFFVCFSFVLGGQQFLEANLHYVEKFNEVGQVFIKSDKFHVMQINILNLPLNVFQYDNYNIKIL